MNNIHEPQDIIEYHGGNSQLHRVSSIFLFDSDNKLLIKQYSKNKETYPLAWTNIVYCYQKNDRLSDQYLCEKYLREDLGVTVPASMFEFAGTIGQEITGKLEGSELKINSIYFVRSKKTSEQILKIARSNMTDTEDLMFVTEYEIDLMLKDIKKLFSPLFRSTWGYIKQSEGKTICETMTLMVETNKNEHEKTMQYIGRVDIPDTTESSDNIILSPFSYVGSMKGKGMRMHIIKAFGKIIGATEERIKFVQEIIGISHNASLVIDDIEDKSKLRRGCKTAHELYGIPLAINAGVFATTLCIEKCNAIDSRCTPILLKAVNDLHRGQGAEIYWTRYKVPPTRDLLLEMMVKKTGTLFRLGLDMLVKGIDSSISPNLLNLLNCWIDCFGVCYQIRDDYINLTDTKYWILKGICDDFDEMKYSFPVVLFIEKMKKEKNKIVNENFFNLFYKLNKTDDDKLVLLRILSDNNILSETYQILQQKIKDLEKILNDLAPLIHLPHEYNVLRNMKNFLSD